MCAAAEKTSCSSLAHKIVKMTANEMMRDATLKLEGDMLKMKEEKTEKLTKAVENRRKVQGKLSIFMKSIKAAEEGVKQLQDQNNLCLAKMLSILERDTNKISRRSQSQQDGQNFLSELMELVDDSSPADTVETLRLKMTKSVEWCDKKLSESMALASQSEFQKTTKIVIQLCDEKDRPIPSALLWNRKFDHDLTGSPPVRSLFDQPFSFNFPHRDGNSVTTSKTTASLPADPSASFRVLLPSASSSSFLHIPPHIPIRPVRPLFNPSNNNNQCNNQ